MGAAANQTMANLPMNNVQTMACSADDLVSYYSRALQEGFFKNKETLSEFRRVLPLGDAIWLLPLPLGVSPFVNRGSIDVPGFRALCAVGAMLFDELRVYFCLTINWEAKAVADPATTGAFAAASRALSLVKDKPVCLSGGGWGGLLDEAVGPAA
ncbi:hypothetical protein [Tunturiibacter gelidiferens]|uniref:hypothetical protein n=1 Tax=Tunturiibacter gelidiferens TaxID=3069689 RepID=UPI003D9B87C6